MFKLVVTAKRKKGMSREEFIRYYNEEHLALARRIMPPLHLHRRNYILTDHPFYDFVGDNRAALGTEPPFDVITEAIYETEEQARQSMRALFNGDTGRQIAEDEANLFEPGSINFYVVEVHQSAIPWVQNKDR